jgi:hypothetical protein
MMEILPFLTSPMGCDLPMSLVLSCSPSLVLHIFRTRASVSIGPRMKRSENSGFMTVKTKADIQKLGGVFTDEEIVDDY